MYSRIIIDVDILTNNKELYSLILHELDVHSIKKYTIRKSDKKISDIKEQILKNNKEKIEWINIEQVGMKYIINIEPKIDKNKKEQKEYCNIISSKDSIITRIITEKGIELKEINDYVKENDIIISGDITYNEETKSQVCASGVVYGKTWYTINISIPKKHEIITTANKKRYNIMIENNNKKYKIFKTRLKDYIDENKEIVNIFGIKIYFQKEKEVTKEIKEYSEEELLQLADNLVKEKMSNNLNGNFNILEQKVLKKSDNDSTIDMDIFIVAEEEISKVSYDQPITKEQAE